MPDPRLQWNEAVQQDLSLRVPSRPLRLSRDLARVSLDRYRIESKDGRKWKSIARERMALAEWLAVHGDGDGSRIFPSEASITRHFGWSRRKTFYLLGDLKELGLLESCGLTSEHGTRVRRMNLQAFVGAGVDSELNSCGNGAGVQHSTGAGVQHSRAGVQSNVAPNRHLTDQTLKPTAAGAAEFPVSCGKNERKRPTTPQRRLLGAAVGMLDWQPDIRHADLKEDLKQWAATKNIEYSASLVEEAIAGALAIVNRRREKTA